MPAAAVLAPTPRKCVVPRWPGAEVVEPASRMTWHRGETLGIADYRCSGCYGLGLRGGRFDATQPCACVLRNIFHALLKHYQGSFGHGGMQSRCALANFGEGKTGRRNWSWGYPDHEFIADFELLAKRVLSPLEAREKGLSVFRMHYIDRFDWRACCRRLGMTKGAFFHTCYRLEECIGRAARELRPYPLYPIEAYYGKQTYNNVITRPTPTGDLRTSSQHMRRAA